jgi:hypothetical protein
MGEKNGNGILVEKPEGKIPLGSPRQNNKHKTQCTTHTRHSKTTQRPEPTHATVNWTDNSGYILSKFIAAVLKDNTATVCVAFPEFQ